MKIAFIGLGNMGGGMAANLVKAGHHVNAFDLSGDARAAAAAAGCEAHDTVESACDSAEAVVTMLPNGEIVRSVYWDQVIAATPKGAIFLDCSTIDVTTAKEVEAISVGAGFEMVDAPVSGGIAAANGGTLTFMVGGTDSAFERAKPILEGMGKAVIHAGEAGAGQTAKICNNMLLAIHMIGTAEAMKMAQKLGLDPQKFYEISSQSSGYNWSLNAYTPLPGVGVESPADNDYKGGFATGLMLKDLRLAMEAADKADAAVPLGARAASLYEDFAGAGNGGLDFSAIIKTY
ncbi:3-hydroxyisobutyrate dehydrogenase [Erythrobacteraceae bacterium WH01K]|nr:3-hydroxyisobutyrate dehydrogenase [Erythrobacteraceae bacterium WH01K]